MKLLSTLTVLAALGLPLLAPAQVPTWQSVFTMSQGAGGSSTVRASATDGLGNVYLAGSFVRDAVFGSTTLNSVGTDDAFVAKYNASGTCLWVQQLGGANAEVITSMSVSGNRVAVAGTFDGAVTTLGTTTYNNVGTQGTDVFLAIITDNGTSSSLAATYALGSADADPIPQVVVRGTTLYVAGTFEGRSLRVGTTVLTSSSMFPLPASDTFVAKFEHLGNDLLPQWAVQSTGDGFETVTGLATNGTAVYVVGQFLGYPVTFGSTQLTPAAQSTDGFLVKLRDAGPTGAFEWAQGFGGDADDQALALAVEGDKIYLAGELGPRPGTFGALSALGSSNVLSDAFVARLTDAGPLGAFDWVQPLGDAVGAEVLTALAVQGGHVYGGGMFLHRTTTLGTTTLTNSSATTTDAFVLSLADDPTSPTVEWVVPIGGPRFETLITLLPLGRRLGVGGSTNSHPATFGPLTLNPTSVTTGGFLALLDGIPLATAEATATRGSFSLGPNPARHTVALRWAAPASPGPVALTLTDPLGRTVRSAAVPSAQLTAGYALDLTGLAPGLYLVRLSSGGTQLTQRLVVE